MRSRHQFQHITYIQPVASTCLVILSKTHEVWNIRIPSLLSLQILSSHTNSIKIKNIPDPAKMANSTKVPPSSNRGHQIKSSQIEATKQIKSSQIEATKQIKSSQIEATKQIKSSQIEATKQIKSSQIEATKQIKSSQIEATKQKSFQWGAPSKGPSNKGHKSTKS